MELRLPCIKPLKLYSVDGNRSIRRSYKSDAKGVQQGYLSFLGTATLSEATEQAVFSGYTCGCHIGETNTDAASGHEMVTIISRFSEWLLWVIVFPNTAIDIVTIILTGIGAVIAINIDTFIKRSVDKVKCNMVNKVCRVWINPLVSLLYLGNQRPNHRPLPMLSVRLLGRQPMIKGRPRNPNFHLIELSLSDVIVANITFDNVTIITIQLNQVTFDMVGDGM